MTSQGYHPMLDPFRFPRKTEIETEMSANNALPPTMVSSIADMRTALCRDE